MALSAEEQALVRNHHSALIEALDNARANATADSMLATQSEIARALYSLSIIMKLESKA